MNAQITYLIARQRNAELRHAGHRARLANEARRKSPDLQPIASTRPTSRSPRGVTALHVDQAIGGE